jgi:hypothetical protein
MCLGEHKPKELGKDLLCPEYREPIPEMYVRDYRRYPPPVVVSTVGFSDHGKTVYLASLFYVFDELANIWPRFFTKALDERTLKIVNDNKKLLKQGKLPQHTPQTFPRPAIVRVLYLPKYHSHHLLFYDTGGEAFESASQMVTHAHFVRRSQTAMFLIRLKNLGDSPGDEMYRLLQTYVQGLAELGGDKKQQHLIVVYTEGDDLGRQWAEWTGLWRDPADGALSRLALLPSYLSGLRSRAESLCRFTREVLRAGQFANMAEDEFRSVEYTVVESLGVPVQGSQLCGEIRPWGIIDPLLWMMEKSLPPWPRFRRQG